MEENLFEQKKKKPHHFDPPPRGVFVFAAGSWACAGERRGGGISGRERPPLYNVSCVSKAPDCNAACSGQSGAGCVCLRAVSSVGKEGRSVCV